MTTSIKQLLDYAILQSVAESYLDRWDGWDGVGDPGCEATCLRSKASKRRCWKLSRLISLINTSRKPSTATARPTSPVVESPAKSPRSRPQKGPLRSAIGPSARQSVWSTPCARSVTKNRTSSGAITSALASLQMPLLATTIRLGAHAQETQLQAVPGWCAGLPTPDNRSSTSKTSIWLLSYLCPPSFRACATVTTFGA
ncbi:MAG: hypothetical protein XXXNARYT_003235 [Candidatus Accumulibacter regalis]